MNKYIAFLRAVNVGGRTLKMDALVKMFESMKLANVKTYIQSGNISFETTGKNRETLRNKIEKILQAELGYEVKVILRTVEELNQVVKQNPFKDKKLDDDTRLYISFLYLTPDDKIKKIVASLDNSNETYSLLNNEVFCLIRKDEKTGTSFAFNQLEKKLGIPVTTRNLTTIIKINNLLNQ